MGLPAARVTDMAGHGGPIALGSFTVFIGGMPAARVGDLFVCPGITALVPHVMGNIFMGSTTVMIDGAFAARMGDITGCNVAGVSGKGMPPISGPGVPGSFSKTDSVFGDNNNGTLWGQYSGYENADGQQQSATGAATHQQGQTKIGDATASGSVNQLTGTVESHKGGAFSGGATASVAAENLQGQIVGKDGTTVAASGAVGSATASYDTLLGDDGRRIGVGMGGALQASVAEGQVDSTNVFSLPFGYDLHVKSTVGGSIESVGAAGAVGAYKDRADNRYHAMGMLDCELLAGFKLGLDISIGTPASASSGAGMPGVGITVIPGTVLSGCPTVLIG